MIYSFNNYIPVIDESAFVHPQAAITGNVIIGKNCYVGPGAALRGDFGKIILEEGCNVQENCTVHMFPGATVILREGSHIGHGAIVHGATIGRNCLVGMNSVILDNADLGDECIIGALTLVREGEKIPSRSLVVGNPGRVIREVSDEMIKWKTEGTKIYQELPEQMRRSWNKVEPLRHLPEERQGQEETYRPWKSGTDRNTT